LLNRTLVKSWAVLPVTEENSRNVTSRSTVLGPDLFVCLYKVSLTHRYRQDSSLTASSLSARPLENQDTIPEGSRYVFTASRLALAHKGLPLFTLEQTCPVKYMWAMALPDSESEQGR